ncbi:hypothetical protein AS156_25715 [Bradyrhizobium macuxiense]|uniref:Uncharacterized protein n=2 Tax=Bradyrhizobium macuxiense TaxID=1755647 RepID=A0A125QAP0_9BRAD|nr:hypothetical protein [Bradyrhizobium macuxiense]KWV61121.1 hypothetical protein AS156_25815 [Bradyrhizobium macuxiense]KWV61130.1 hypothetical protein AS156_25780 [Bradyrhizobium macuxiense]KWV61136.1 hypothetical protein AS156_25715 [Bradyrhizobium macuxiense]
MDNKERLIDEFGELLADLADDTTSRLLEYSHEDRAEIAVQMVAEADLAFAAWFDDEDTFHTIPLKGSDLARSIIVDGNLKAAEELHIACIPAINPMGAKLLIEATRDL